MGIALADCFALGAETVRSVTPAPRACGGDADAELSACWMFAAATPLGDCGLLARVGLARDFDVLALGVDVLALGVDARGLRAGLLDPRSGISLVPAWPWCLDANNNRASRSENNEKRPNY